MECFRPISFYKLRWNSIRHNPVSEKTYSCTVSMVVKSISVLSITPYFYCNQLRTLVFPPLCFDQFLSSTSHLYAQMIAYGHLFCRSILVLTIVLWKNVLLFLFLFKGWCEPSISFYRSTAVDFFYGKGIHKEVGWCTSYP